MKQHVQICETRVLEGVKDGPGGTKREQQPNPEATIIPSALGGTRTQPRAEVAPWENIPRQLGVSGGISG